MPGVLRELLHIFPMKNQSVLQKTQILALKRTAKRPFWVPNTHFSNEQSIILMQKPINLQGGRDKSFAYPRLAPPVRWITHFSNEKSILLMKIDTFSMGGLVLVFGWSWGGLGVVKDR